MHAVYQKLGEQSHFMQIQTKMRLLRLQLTTGSVPSFSTQYCQCAIDTVARILSKGKRFWLCLFHLGQKEISCLKEADTALRTYQNQFRGQCVGQPGNVMLM